MRLAHAWVASRVAASGAIGRYGRCSRRNVPDRRIALALAPLYRDRPRVQTFVQARWVRTVIALAIVTYCLVRFFSANTSADQASAAYFLLLLPAVFMTL